MPKFYIVSVLIFSLVVSHSLHAKGDSLLDISTACQNLKRPNIDCICVDNRMKMLMSITDSTAVKKVLSERYAHAVGQDSALEAALRVHSSDSTAMISSQMAYDRVGGFPENIEELEKGCVIASATQFHFGSPPRSGSAADLYLEAVVKSVGESYRRQAVCNTKLMSEYLSEDEFTAYFLSYTYYEGDHNNDDLASRAKKMGVSKPEFQSLEKLAREKISQNATKGENYCSAMTYADQISTAQSQSYKEQQKTLLGKIPRASQTTGLLSGDDETKARQLTHASCLENGSSKAYCECLMTDFETKVVKNSPRPAVTLLWSLMRDTASANDGSVMQLMMQSTQEDQQAAAQLLMVTLDVGEGCPE